MPEVVQLELVQYVAEDGKCPFREWLLGLRDAKARAKVRARLARARGGNLGDAKSLKGGLHEMRVDHGPGYRVYFGKEGARLVILLCGGDKSSQGRDIETARALWAEYRRRKG